jgi:hypothetical protein
MPDLGRKYTCYSCHTKFYDLGKPIPLCPKCGADQRDAEDAPVVTTSRRSRSAPVPVVVDEPADDAEFGGEEGAAPATAEGEDEEEAFVAPEREEEEADDEEEEEF